MLNMFVPDMYLKSVYDIDYAKLIPYDLDLKLKRIGFLSTSKIEGENKNDLIKNLLKTERYHISNLKLAIMDQDNLSAIENIESFKQIVIDNATMFSTKTNNTVKVEEDDDVSEVGELYD